MRYSEIIRELRKKSKPASEPNSDDITPQYNYAWDQLNSLKEYALSRGNIMAGSYQLFVPRRNPNAMTARDIRLRNLANKYAYDDQGNIKPEYEKYERGPIELSPVGPQDNIKEASPILPPTKPVNKSGNNKPNANLWTSTAIKTENGWTSDWAKWTYNNQRDWLSNTGYLYKVKPGALVLSLDSTYDAEEVYNVFSDLGRLKEIPEYLKGSRPYYKDLMRYNFPWDEISKHFDAVWHSGSRYDHDFMYGWDVESTAWFDTDFLQLIGEVPVVGYQN